MNMNKSLLLVSTATVQVTLDFLRSAGERGCEGVVLWLGRREADSIAVTEAYVPEQEAAGDFFRIPPHAIAALLTYLGENEVFIAAQVHSHPFEAFHSEADNAWAIVRHRDALSLVVPYFARATFADGFVGQIAAFQLSATNVWQELDAGGRQSAIGVS